MQRPTRTTLLNAVTANLTALSGTGATVTCPMAD